MEADPRDARIVQLEQENTQLQVRVQQLLARIEELETLAVRQAAPFRRKDKNKKPPQEHHKPGRPAGHPGSYRPIPPQIDQHIEVPLSACPYCGAAAENLRRCEQYIEEIPPIRPHVTHLVTYQGVCRHCRRSIASVHPLQVSAAGGAAGVHLGTRALALAGQLTHQAGLTMRKVCQVLESLTGLHLSPGGLAQALHRMADKTADWLAAEEAALQTDPVVHSDETGWWLGSRGTWLWVFTNARRTIYRIEDHRNRDVVLDMLGEHYGGVLVSDCLVVYENLPYRMHKCYAHHLKAISEGLEGLPAQRQGYLLDLRGLLKAAMMLDRLRKDLSAEEFARCRKGLQQRAESLLAFERTDPIEQHVRKRLLKRLGQLFTFLDVPGVEATNNRAERGLRPAVISRKLSCGNKTDRGRRTWQTLRSLIVTCQQQKQDWVERLRPYLLLPQPATIR